MGETLRRTIGTDRSPWDKACADITRGIAMYPVWCVVYCLVLCDVYCFKCILVLVCFVLRMYAVKWISPPYNPRLLTLRAGASGCDAANQEIRSPGTTVYYDYHFQFALLQKHVDALLLLCLLYNGKPCYHCNCSMHMHKSYVCQLKFIRVISVCRPPRRRHPSLRKSS